MNTPFPRFAAALAKRYSIGQEIDRSAVAVVFRARDLKHDRDVVLKVLRPEVSSRGVAQRFQREICTAAALSHPHIMPVHDSGEAAGLSYYVMPVVDGEPLRALLRRATRLPVADALLLVRGVAAALDYAHRQGLVHGDLRPENILVHDGHPLVADFGVARAFADSANGNVAAADGSARGTAYLSPEQLLGDETVDGRSDLYSLGCVFFEVLTGQAAFPGSTRWSAIAQRCVRHARGTDTMHPDVPDGVSRIVARLLAPNVADRYQTGAELVAAVQVPHGETRAVGYRSVAVLPFANVSDDPEAEYFSDGMTEDIINTLARQRGLRVIPRTTSFAYKGSSDDVGAIARRLGVTAALEGTVRKSGNRVCVAARLVDPEDGRSLWSEEFDRELVDLFAIQDEIGGAIAARLRATLTEPAPSLSGAAVPAERMRAYDLYLRGRYHWNQRGAGLLTGLELFKRAVELDPALAQAHTGIADATSLLAFYSQLHPSQAAPVARTAATQAVALDPTLAEAHGAAGWVSMTFDWNWDGAGRSLARAMMLNPAYVPARLWYAAFLGFVQGEVADGVALTSETVQLDPASVFARVHLGALLIYARRYDEAITALEQGRALDPASFLAHRYLSMAYRLTGRLDEALRSAEAETGVAGDHPWALADLAMSHHALGNDRDADQVVETMIAARERRYVQPVLLACVLGRLGRLADAVDWFALGVRERDPAAFIYGWPDLDPIRELPGFRAALDKGGLRIPGDRSR